MPPLPIVDFHTHYACPAYPALPPRHAAPELAERWRGMARRIADLDGLLAEAGRHGIDLRVLSAPPALVTPHGERTHQADLRRLNDHLAEAVASAPERLRGLATIDAFAGDAAADEAVRAIRELGLSGLVVDCATDDQLLGAKAARPTLTVAAELGVPVFAHPISPDLMTRSFAGLGRYGTSLARGTINAAALLSLLADGVFADLPDLHVVFPMLGLAGLALAAATDPGETITVAAPAGQRAHVYLDTMGFTPAAIRFATDLLGADHVLVGGDWPIAVRETSRERVETTLTRAGLDGEQRRLVAGANALRLLAA
ncbi:amidohydrolase family protein [Micromonospora endophytica]|uniref:Amidohydrolase 2 n=1 Tax=Micromonospora endophytica TaxID=515350 RepID=A0A2W2D9Q1_9ACTN|nr:amidohydrolase family protein [Micromonospora endophytica]PZG00639.1 amidohydrolase 2 [Micromonospora endophytica]RIW51465.1 amidohydrolase 2 [Micromonospora endophytica]BCJ62192.1 amidohydrolase [Micromonospora endophytica]